jgi:hypothetical protein
MANPADIAPMLHEIATVGTAMAVTITVIWAVIVIIVELKVKYSGKTHKTRVIRGAV